MLHGYAHGEVCFYKILKEMSKERIVYSIDILGMGLSHRPNFELNKPEEILEFFSNRY